MRTAPRWLPAGLAAAGLGLAQAPWWRVSFTGVLAGQEDLTGVAVTQGLAQVLPVAALGGLLLTLTLGTGGRRAVGVLLALIFAGMVAVGAFSHRGVDAAAASAGERLLAQAWSSAPTGGGAGYAAVGALGVAAAGWYAARPGGVRSRGSVTPADVTDPLGSWKAMDAGLDPTDDRPREEHA